MSEKLDQHELISEVLRLAQELGKTPSRDEFSKNVKGGRNAVERSFGSYSTFLQAAGLGPYQAPKITNEIFNRDIRRHLESYEPREQKEIEPYQRTLFVPDIHFPFAHQKTLEKIYRFAEKEKPEVVVQVGDLYDSYSHSKFPRSHNIFTPREETELARKQAETFWSEIAKAAPDSKKYQLCGNHDARMLKRILEVYPGAEDWIVKMLEELMSFQGVKTILDAREELMLPGEVACIHGFRSQTGQHRDYLMHNVVAGHLHIGNVSFRQMRGRVLWELNCGLAGDPESKGLSYTPTKITNWTLGWGWLDQYGPRFVHA